MTRSALVIGAGGFLGPHLVRALLDAGFQGVVGVRSGAGEVEATLDEARPALVLLSAALSRVGDCEQDPALAHALNVDLPRRTAEWCAPHGARLVHVSTDLVFGGTPPHGERYTEDDPPSPVHEYGRTKAAGEVAVLSAFPDALVVRLPLLYGDSAGQGLGASDSILAALERGDTPRLFTDEWRTPLDVSVAAAALVEAVGTDHRGLLHVAGPRRLSRYDLGIEVLRAHGLPTGNDAPIVACRQADLGMADTRPADVSLDAGRARALLATPLRPPEESLSGPAT